jgi:hypothetical protein
VFGQSTITATVAAASPGGGTPTGTVTFTVDGTAGTPVALANGQATLDGTLLSVGTHTVTAAYNGDASFTASTSSAVTQTVNKANTTTTVTSSVNPSVSGQAVTFTAVVAAVAPGAGTPTGTVTFTVDGTAQAPVTLTNGQATFNATTLSIGTHTVTAAYSGDANFNTSTSAAVTQTVNKANSTTTLTSSANPSNVGQAVTFTATVSPGLGATGTPTGTVVFTLDGTSGLMPVALVNGQATFTTSTLTAGTHTITVAYSGDATFNVSTSAPLTQTVSGVTLGTNQRFVAQIYRDLLGREADPGGLAFWSGNLDQNTQTRMQVVLGIESSQEYKARTVTQLFNQLLRRAPDPVGLQGLTIFLGQGHTSGELEALILGSPEYYTRIGGGTRQGFLNAVYQDVLGRPIDPAGQVIWQNQLSQRDVNSDNVDGEDARKARTAVAGLIFASPESGTHLVQGLYNRYLGRAADTGGLNAFVSARQSGVPMDTLVALMLTSQEYANTRVR